MKYNYREVIMSKSCSLVHIKQGQELETTITFSTTVGYLVYKCLLSE
jgi:hypothetical protein